jgi:hypothetical protein
VQVAVPVVAVTGVTRLVQITVALGPVPAVNTTVLGAIGGVVPVGILPGPGTCDERAVTVAVNRSPLPSLGEVVVAESCVWLDTVVTAVTTKSEKLLGFEAEVPSRFCGVYDVKIFCTLFDVRYPPVVELASIPLAKVKTLGVVGLKVATVNVPLNDAGCAPKIVTDWPGVTEHSPAQVTVAVVPFPVMELICE